MRLSRHSDYAIRVLIFLGVNPERLCTIKEISDSYGISKNHLVKVVHALSKAGYVDSLRGKGGGIRLGRDPKDISIGQLIRSMEFDFEIVECFNPKACHCRIAPVCSLKRILAEALEAFLEHLDRHSLADLLEPAVGLRKRLSLDRS